MEALVLKPCIALCTTAHPIKAECSKAMLQTWLSVGKTLELPEPYL